MDKKSREMIGGQYTNLVRKHGLSMRSLHTEGSRYEEAHQRVKFQRVLKVLEPEDSLLDVGCGLGDLAEYCRGAGWKERYTGIDISSGMVEAARLRLKTSDIYQIDILEDAFAMRYDVVASISTLQEKPRYEDGAIYLDRMIKRMFEICSKCVVFDVFSNRFADFEKPDNIYVDPAIFLEKLYGLANRIILFNDYNPFQLMVVLYKETISGWR